MSRPKAFASKSGCVIAGQPGIGKTVCLIYLLLDRLSRRETVAIQFEEGFYSFFHENGVERVSTQLQNYEPIHAMARKKKKEILFLADLNKGTSSRPKPCFLAFTVYASSPNQTSLQHIVKKVGFPRIYMELWSRAELITLAHIQELSEEKYIGYAEKWGPSPRSLTWLMSGVEHEEEREDLLNTALTKFFKYGASTKSLTGTARSPSILFFIQPRPGDPRRHTVVVPTRHLVQKLGHAFLTAASDRRLELFQTLNSHAQTRAAAGWIFEGLAYHTFSTMRENVKVQWRDGTLPTMIHAVALESITGLDGLKQRGKGSPFYWQPGTPNFPTVDAVLYDGTTMYLLQVTVAKTHASSPTGLDKILSAMDKKLGPMEVAWKFVFVGHVQETIMKVAKATKMPVGWENIMVGWCILDLPHCNTWKLPSRLSEDSDGDVNMGL